MDLVGQVRETGMNADLVFTARRIELSVTLDVVVIAYTLVMEARVVILPESVPAIVVKTVPRNFSIFHVFVQLILTII